MGMTRVGVKVMPVGRPDAAVELQMLLDTGAIYTVLPNAVWQALGLTPMRREEFALADGTGIVTQVAECVFDIAGRSATSPVVPGEGDDAPLLGMVTLETLGLMIDPLSRRVQPMRVLPLRALATAASA
jgi:clan AA aspartic protease